MVETKLYRPNVAKPVLSGRCVQCDRDIFQAGSRAISKHITNPTMVRFEQRANEKLRWIFLVLWKGVLL